MTATTTWRPSRATLNPTARRCILNVATGRYAPLQERLVRSLVDAGYADGLLTWTDFPPGSPTHEDTPYAFKLFAIREAERRGYTSVLWLDAPCTAAGPVAPLFERIERDGHLFVTGGERLGRWASDACLEAFGLSRDAALELPLLNGTFLGLALPSPWLDELQRRLDLLRGPWLSEHAPPDVRARKPERSIGFVSRDPRAWGHRHDEAVGSGIAHRLGMAISPQQGLFNLEGAPIRSDKS